MVYKEEHALKTSHSPPQPHPAPGSEAAGNTLNQPPTPSNQTQPKTFQPPHCFKYEKLRKRKS